MAENRQLTNAKSAKNDEFYTQYADIQKGVNASLDYAPDVFQGKTVLPPPGRTPGRRMVRRGRRLRARRPLPPRLAVGLLAHLFRHRFSTKYFDAETSLYYYGYRFYSPELMRWLNRDPIEEAGGENLYAFCGNNGVANFDSLGKIPVKFVSWRESLSGYENVEVHAVSDIEVETGTMRDHGGFSPIFVPSSGQCELEVRLKITLSDGLVHHAPNGVSYTYQPHFAKAGSDILGGGVSSTIPYGQPQIYDEVLAHERGHAWAFLLFTKPIFEAYASAVKAPVKSSDVPILKRMFSKSRMLSASKSAEYANEATINWFTSHGFDIFYDGREYEFK